MAAEGNTLLVRCYRDDDHDAVWELHNLALDSVGTHGGNGPWDDDLHLIPSVYIDAAGEFLVGLVEGDIVAIGGLRQSGPGQGEIKRMRVHPRFQRRGFGREILLRLENRARELGYETASSRHDSRPDRGPGALQTPRLHGDAPHPRLAPSRSSCSRSPFALDPGDTTAPAIPCRVALPLCASAGTLGRADPECRIRTNPTAAPARFFGLKDVVGTSWPSLQASAPAWA